MKIVQIFRLKIVIFTALKNRCMLHGRVFVMVNSVAISFFVGMTPVFNNDSVYAFASLVLRTSSRFS